MVVIIKAFVTWRTNSASHLVEVKDENNIVPTKNVCECGSRIPYGEVWPTEGVGLSCRKCKNIEKKREARP